MATLDVVLITIAVIATLAAYALICQRECQSTIFCAQSLATAFMIVELIGYPVAAHEPRNYYTVMAYNLLWLAGNLATAAADVIVGADILRRTNCLRNSTNWQCALMVALLLHMYCCKEWADACPLFLTPDVATDRERQISNLFYLVCVVMTVRAQPALENVCTTKTLKSC